MNKTVLGTIIGATLLGLVKNRGSMARAIIESKALENRFKELNGFGFLEFCSFLTNTILNDFILNGKFREFQELSLDSDKLEITTLFIYGEEEDDCALKYKNLSGNEKFYQFIFSRVCDVHTAVFLNVDSIEEYNQANIEANEELREKISDYEKKPNRINAIDLSQTLIGGYFMSGSPNQLAIQMLHTDESNTNAIETLLQNKEFLKDFKQEMYNLIIHEFYHAIEPKKEEIAGGRKNNTGRSYYASKRERPTIGNDIVISLLLDYPRLSDLEKKELHNAIRNRDFGTMCIYNGHLFNAFLQDKKDREQAYLFMFYKMGGEGEYNEEEYAKLVNSLSDEEYSEMQNDLLRNEYNVYLKNKYKDRKSFYSLHKWFGMIERAFKDRGFL